MKNAVITLATVLLLLTNESKASDLSKNSKLETIDVSKNEFPLHMAISKGDLQSVKKFIEYGVNVNKIVKDMSPLMVAAFYNRVEIIEVLLKHGADFSIKNEKGFTALNYAEYSNAFECQILLKNCNSNKKF